MSALPKRILVTGASGLVGKALCERLRGCDYEVLELAHRARAGAVAWDIEKGFLDASSLEGLEGVVHLAGEPIAGVWTVGKQSRILNSRVNRTALLAQTLAQLDQKPRVFVCASAVGFYGLNSQSTDEDATSGEGFLASVCEAWERAADPAKAAGIRVVHSRLGIVLSPEGGALAAMLPAFKLGFGGRLGDGKQLMSWVSLKDVVSALVFSLEHDELCGAFNLTAPNPVDNATFTKTLARVLKRPACLLVPEWVLKMFLWSAADELLLNDCRAEPKKLLNAGFAFEDIELEYALRDLFSQTKP